MLSQAGCDHAVSQDVSSMRALGVATLRYGDRRIGDSERVPLAWSRSDRYANVVIATVLPSREDSKGE